MSLNGILIVNKNSGLSSNNIVKKIKKKINCKIGHTGTLDVLAEGILILLIGLKTKKFIFFLNLPKTYVAKISFFFSTFTDDVFGKKKNFLLNKKINNIKFLFLISRFKKKKQIPHKFSAKKKNGKKNYKKSLILKTIKIKKQKIKINFFFLFKKKKYMYLKVNCSSGIYIRSIIRDINIKYNINMNIIKLKRIKIGKIKIKNSINYNILFNKKNIIKNIITK